MPNLNQIILTGADYKIFLSIPGGGVYPLQTTDSVSYNIEVEGELIFATGTQEPIGNKTNARSYKGKLSMQAGEINAIELIEGLPSISYVTGAVISATAIQGGFTKTFVGVNITSESGDIKRKDKETLVSMDFMALGLAQ